MKWIEPEHSKEKVKKAGKYIFAAGVDEKKFREAVPIFFNWRSAHAFPMQIMLDLLRKNAIRVDKHALVVQRLKRVPSIFYKLIREKGMSLSRMEDIAGCRAVLHNTQYVNQLLANLKKSRTKNILHRERDYISKPKESGYRGVHLVFKYNGTKEKYRGLFVELQLRSKVQHSWATAVEVVGTFTKQALKASSGEARWLDFFKYASVEFAKLENCPIEEKYTGVDTFQKLKDCVDVLEINKRLSAFNVAVKTISAKSTTKGAGYFLMSLDLKRRVVNLRGFNKSQLEEATQTYNEEEQKYSEDKDKDLVLVSAGSLLDLKRAYPNYFSDTQNFSKYIEKVYKLNNHIYPTA